MVPEGLPKASVPPQVPEDQRQHRALDLNLCDYLSQEGESQERRGSSAAPNPAGKGTQHHPLPPDMGQAHVHTPHIHLQISAQSRGGPHRTVFGFVHSTAEGYRQQVM